MTEPDWIDPKDIERMMTRGAKLRRSEWRRQQGRDSGQTEIAVPDFQDDDLECLRLSAKVEPLHGTEAENVRRAVHVHGFPAVLRTLYLIAYEREQAAQVAHEIMLEAPEVEPFAVFACKLDELAASHEASLK